MITIKTQPCPLCEKQTSLQVDEDKFNRWQGGEFIQDIFPDVSSEIRELLVTGTHSDCWDKMFGESDEEESETCNNCYGTGTIASDNDKGREECDYCDGIGIV